MFPVRRLCLTFGLFVFAQFATGQTVVNSIYVGPAFGTYSVANNWAPAEVPNNTDAKNYNVTVPRTVSLAVDIDATISNLTLGSFLSIYGNALAVTGATSSPADQAPDISLGSSASDPGTFNAGTFPAFSGNTLKGRYIIASGGAAATLQFNGANVVSLGEGELSLYGALARVVDENGNDGLRNLARVESGAVLELDGRDLTVAVPFTNNGTLTLGGDNATIFTIANSLSNFDSGTHTLSGGKFVLNQFAGGSGNLPTELRFAGADIVNNGSAIELGGTASRIADLAGADGLRNLAKILPGASLTLRDRDFATTGGFGNDGLLSLTRSTFIVTGPFANFDPATRTLSGGTYEIIDNAGLKFSGADIVNNGALVTLAYGGSITDITGSNGLRSFSNNLAGAAFILGQGEDFTAPGDFDNAGRIETVGYNGGIPENPPAYGTFTVPAGFAYTQTAGTTANDGILTADRINIFGGSLVSDIGTINGNVTVTDATIFPGLSPVVNGNLTLNSGSHYHTSIDRFGEIGALNVAGTVAVAGNLDIEISDQIFLGSDAVLTVLQSNTSITGAFGNAPNGARIPTLDGRGSFVVVYEPKRVTLTQFMATPPPAQLLNISTRTLISRPADDIFGDRRYLIGGFIISGAEPKTVAVRGIGPSLSKFGLDPILVDPVLELHSSSGVIVTNDNWRDTQPTEILQSGLAPEDEREAAIITTLNPGSYTAVLKEKNGLAGYGLVEVYDLSQSSNSKLANISTRGYTDANTVLIGGIIVGGDGQANDDVVVRAIGPHLRQNGVFDALQDPTLELRDSNGNLLAFNDDWLVNSDQVPAEFHPYESTESAMRVSFARGIYTAIVRPKGNGGGVGLVEFYDLRR